MRDGGLRFERVYGFRLTPALLMACLSPRPSLTTPDGRDGGADGGLGVIDTGPAPSTSARISSTRRPTVPGAPAVPAVSVESAKWTRAAASRARMSVAASASRMAMSRIARRAAARAPCRPAVRRLATDSLWRNVSQRHENLWRRLRSRKRCPCGGDCPGGQPRLRRRLPAEHGVRHPCGELPARRARRPRTAPRLATALSAASPAPPATMRAAHSACPTPTSLPCGASCTGRARAYHRRHGDVRRHLVRGHLPKQGRSCVWAAASRPHSPAWGRAPRERTTATASVSRTPAPTVAAAARARRAPRRRTASQPATALSARSAAASAITCAAAPVSPTLALRTAGPRRAPPALPPANGSAICDGLQCGFQCTTGFPRLQRQLHGERQRAELRDVMHGLSRPDQRDRDLQRHQLRHHLQRHLPQLRRAMRLQQQRRQLRQLVRRVRHVRQTAPPPATGKPRAV